ncbi:MAG: zinc ribbon domain-containing protein [Thermoleophilia bacterium]|nr:zinc ribbon domain-containing protein [Thermoleophilia bacterium]MDQ3857058.1 zinc ribbon domain-containing protein [Actinomycetota bacterium]
MTRHIFLLQATDEGDDAFGSVSEFFHSELWLLIRNITLFFVLVFWLASAFWVYKDARRRIEDPWLLAMAVALGLFPPFIGPLIYMLFRPPEYVEDVRERELEIKAMEENLSAQRCPVCRADVDASFLSCPVCTTKLRQACRRCKAPLEPLWQICPYCETPVEATPRAVETL